MPRRKDALLGAARIVELVNQIGLSKAPLGVSTVGMLNPYPNSRNVIPGEVFMTCEFRHPIDATLTEMDAALREGVEAIAKKIGLTYDLKQVFYYHAGRLRQGLRRRGAPRGASISATRIATSSPAPGTTLAISRGSAPTSMIFTPCVDGVSHNESEDIKRNGRPPAPTC